MSYLPTVRAMLQTNHNKGSFQNKELCALLEPVDLMKGNCSQSVVLGVFDLAGL